MIGLTIVSISAIVLVVGLILIAWDWIVRDDPDAPHGGPVVIIAIVGLLCGGMVACSETIRDVQQMKRAHQETPQ